MNIKYNFIVLTILFSQLFSAQRQMEYLKRGIVAMPSESGVFVSWRLLGTEPQNVQFDVFRLENKTSKKLNEKPLLNETSFLDKTADKAKNYTYFVKSNTKNQKIDQDSAKYVANQKPYFSIPLKTPVGYTPNDASVADLDGDGEYEIILHQTGQSKDNSQKGFTDEPIIQAYKLNGKLLWEINLGKNIREGAHYTQFLVYDLDQDGKAEVVMKTADGSKDSKGKFIGDPSKDYRNENGFILSGPEFLTVFNGETGEEINTVNYQVPRFQGSLNPTPEQLTETWGDAKGNRVDRFLGAVAYLDGKTPSVIMSRGYYTRTAIAAWDYKDKKLILRWLFDTESSEENKKYRGQGNHNLSIADVDNDGKDEIIFGAMTVDDNGKVLNSTGFGHGDALHVGNLDPSNPGLEIFDIQERFDDAGAHFRAGASGKVLWKLPSLIYSKQGKFQGPGRGLSLNIDPRYEGSESWAAGAGLKGVYDTKGRKISEKNPSVNMGIYWDGDFLSEILDGTSVSKWDWNKEKSNLIFDAKDFQCESNNGTKKNPSLVADLFGDWREEVIYRTSDNKELRIFSSTIPTKHRLYTLMHNPQYRLSIVWQNVGYNQPPHTDYYLDESVSKIPAPNIHTVKP
ncbi:MULTISPECIES: rhamnogalacturonan lyase [Chryseobacterium]|uniref:Rhamnogalacturonan endolyase n=1 Tax=Chryseobacterium geocarposphaerae TaxID=1416776 RepID=A0ABU1L8X0_9FLAO|nr:MULTISPECIES: rhamnogalacturonan lyase [Chryseobacterium]MDR6403169.1 rhamnogalacturonan endolyase [Chryseobacterium geocarposphaerae]MDR6696724.1 rhamnogalacturonan endolyase [Chryseobacterium ginsenosidimutans]